MIEFCAALIMHVGLAGDFRDSSLCVRYVDQPYTVGAYTNSIGHPSIYASYTMGGTYYAEIGVVTGYFNGSVPFAAVGYDFGKTRIFVAPAHAKGKTGMVLTLERTF